MGTKNTCVVCFKPQQNRLCDNCIQTVKHKLERTADLIDAIWDSICKQDQTLRQVRVYTKKVNADLPIDLDALEVRDVVMNTVHSWIKDLDHTDLPDKECDRVRWLAKRVEHWRNSDDAEMMYDELLAAWHLIETKVDLPVEWKYFGECLAPVGDDRCQGELHVTSFTQPTVTCPECETAHDVATRKAEKFSDLEYRAVTIPEAHAFLSWMGNSIPKARLYEWASRKRILPTYAEANIYRLRDVVELAASYVPRRKKSQ